jgi:hypothetical protein
VIWPRTPERVTSRKVVPETTFAERYRFSPPRRSLSSRGTFAAAGWAEGPLGRHGARSDGRGVPVTATKWLQSYLNEYAWRYNHREFTRRQSGVRRVPVGEAKFRLLLGLACRPTA